MPRHHATLPGHRARTGWAATLLAALALTACGTGDTETSTAQAPAAASSAAAGDSPAAFPVSVEADNGSVEIAAEPAAIVSLSPTATENLYAVGAGDQVVAVDDQSNYPAQAPMTALSGFQPNVEAVIGYEPDLVLTSDDESDLVGRLESLGVPVLQLGAAETLEDAYDQIETIGAATGHPEEAAEVVADMQARLEAAVADAPTLEEPLTVYHELDPTLYSATSATFIGSIYAELGLVNIADAASTAGNGYPQINAEAVVAADPDIIVLADTKCCQQSAATLAERPGWAGITAVRTGGVIEADDDIASRWSPRVVELAELVGAKVDELAAVPVP